MELEESMEEYLVAMVQAGCSRATRKQYGWHLARLSGWLAAQGVRDLADVSRSALRAWGAEIREGWAPATCKQATNAARSWLRWCGEEYGIGGDLVSALRVPRVPRRVQRVLSVAEVAAMLDICDGSVKGRRDGALVSLLVDTGLRAGEVCRLQVDDLDLVDGRVLAVVKGGDQRWAYFGQGTGLRLRVWLEARSAVARCAALFVSVGGGQPGQALTRDGLRGILRVLGRQAGVAGVCTHAFRRSFACMMIEAGAPSRVVQLAGRWSNLAMVERYTAGLDAGRVVRQYSAVDWLEGVEDDR